MTSRISELLNRLGFFAHRHSERSTIKSFKADQIREQAFDIKDRGILEIPLDRIVGSVGRYHDFDQKFRIGPHLPPDRLENLKSAMRAGKSLPPVKLYQIKNDYYVLDGNHRVAAAKEIGFAEIKAHIYEFLPSKKSLENLLYLEKAEFKEQTGLSYDIELTEPGQYHHLIQQISKHKNFLQTRTEAPVATQTAAEDWYKTIYSPLLGLIKKGGLIEYFPRRKPADLYAYISVHQWEKNDQELRFGIGINELDSQDMEEFRNKMADLKEIEYPEMLREITAFVLINTSAKQEIRIADKLFGLAEVEEVHSVHGSIDIIAKIVITRNLTSSDAETIGDFVHQKVRQIPGIMSTQTLIPGYSRQRMQK